MPSNLDYALVCLSVIGLIGIFAWAALTGRIWMGVLMMAGSIYAGSPAVVMCESSALLQTVAGADHTFTLASPFHFSVDGDLIEVPKGFTTDLASTPHLGEFYIANDDADIAMPAIAHDWIYQHAGVLAIRTFTRSQADTLLRDLMKYTTRNETNLCHRINFFIRRQITWLAVRIGGDRAWDANRPAHIKHR